MISIWSPNLTTSSQANQRSRIVSWSGSRSQPFTSDNCWQWHLLSFDGGNFKFKFGVSAKVFLGDPLRSSPCKLMNFNRFCESRVVKCFNFADYFDQYIFCSRWNMVERSAGDHRETKTWTFLMLREK